MTTIKSIDRIISAKDYGGSMTNYLRSLQLSFKKSGKAVNIIGLDKAPTGTPVKARIWQSQWVADCGCNTTMFVDPDEPFFFCFGCANRLNGGKIRPVEFPPEPERKEIERLLLERPVDDVAGMTDLERVGLQKPLLFVQVEGKNAPLVRSWEGESVADLEKQQRSAIEAWHKDLRNGI